MAAHSLRILMEMGGEQKLTEEVRAKYIHALAYAPGMGLLSLTHWARLDDALKDSDIRVFDLRDKVMEILAYQGAQWLALDKPKDTEEWHARLHEKHEANLYWSDADLRFNPSVYLFKED